MNSILWICSTILVINTAQSYILLTANLEDVQSIAKQLVDSPIADQLKRIWRRASNQFNQQVDKSRVYNRAEDVQEDKSEEKTNGEHQESGADEHSSESHAERRQGDDVAALAKNASFYLSSIKNIMKNV